MLKSRHPFSLSRKVAHYIVLAIVATLFLLAIGLAGFYAYYQNSSWEGLAGVGALLLVAIIIFSYAILSGRLRNSIRVKIDKHFFKHKYDYRRVWLNLIHTLSQITEDEDFFEQGLQAVGKIFDAEGGALWLTDGTSFNLKTSWNIAKPLNSSIPCSTEFICPFAEEEWIYALNLSGRKDHDRYLNLLPQWVTSIDNIWILAPLMLSKKMSGFFLLTRKSNNDPLIWEDIDVIKSAGRQFASYIVRQQSAEQLAESRQFDTYNKLTAFIMHDLKNLIAQQALVVENAQKHKENPAFVEDAIRTIDNSVTRMNQLLRRLQRSSTPSVLRSVIVRDIITESVRKSTDRQPIPTFRGDEINATIVADREQMIMILLHIIRNAQDATKNDGFIDIEVREKDGNVLIDVEDNGCGMDDNFIKTRLFKPFDSTKSSMGMGIGAYQVREFIESMGGKLKISSQKDAGTTVCIQLPISQNESVRAVSQ